MGLFSFLDFGGNAIKDALLKGAIVVDVRTPHEYDQGRVRDSLNIPIDQVPKNVGYLKSQNRPIIVCGSGYDSAEARRILQRAGIKEVYNGGSWERVARLMKTI